MYRCSVKTRGGSTGSSGMTGQLRWVDVHVFLNVYSLLKEHRTSITDFT